MSGTNNNGMQPYDVKEYSQDMPYKGGLRGAETPSTGYIAGTHAHITDKARKEQLKDIGLETREEYIDGDADSNNAIKEIRLQRIKRKCFLFVTMLVLSMILGTIVSGFYGWGSLTGLGIGAVVGTILFILPMIVYVLTNIIKKR